MKNASIEIIKILKNAGHTAYWAGGCVRDMLLGVKPKDFDIVTSAKPDEIENLLKKTIPIGKKYGVILAIENGHHFEIATFRSDSGYSDGRRPDAVIFTDAKEDAKRRDFTINGMFYDPLEDQIIDYVDGQLDLRDQLVRFIGDPETRIKEDNLRILRAIRIKNNYDLQYHPDTYKAIKKHYHLVKNISPERVRDELNKMIMHTNPGRAFQEMFELDILEILIPELVALKGLAQPKQYHQEGDVWDHSIRALEALTNEEDDPNPLPAEPPTVSLKWAAFMHDIGKAETFSIDENRIRYDKHSETGAEIAVNILKRFKFPKKTIEKVKWVISHHMMVVPLFEMSDARRRSWFLKPYFPELLEVYRADAMGIEPMDLSAYDKMKNLYNKEIAHLKLMPKQLISGDKVMQVLGLKPGQEVGEILKKVKEAQLAKEISTEEEALEFVKNLN
jgi:poly(A) polymerase